jgi:hypothetical protein
MSKGPKVISMVKIHDAVGEQWYYAGTDQTVTAIEMALGRGHESENLTIKQIPNKFGIQFGEWRQAVP